MKRYAFPVIVGTACVVVGFSSYRMGRERTVAKPAANAAQAGKAVQATDTVEEPVSSRPPAELLSLKQKLKHSYVACPSAKHDWILRGQTAAVLATLTTAELRQMLDELLPSRGAVWRKGEPMIILATDLLREWGRRDPVAACTAMVEVRFVGEVRMAAFQDWLRRDPRAVERWMNSGGDTVPAGFRKAWLSERAKTDPYDAIQQLAGLTPEQRQASLLEWSTSFALQPGERKALLDAVREDPALLRRCAGNMAAALVDRSVEEAYEFVDSLDLDEKTATSLDDGILVKWGMRDPQVAFAAWAEQKPTRLPENFLHVLDNWSMNSPGAEQAIKWLDTVESGRVKEEIQVHFIDNLTGGERFEQAARMGLSMENRDEGKRQMMRVVATWKEKFPGHARERLAVIFREAGVEVP